MKSYKQHWVELIRRNLDGYEEIALGDDFEDWNRLILYEGQVELALNEGLELLCGDAPRALAERFFSRCVALADRAIDENVFRKKPRTRAFYPINRARTLRAKCYARWFLTGELQRELLTEAIKDVLAWCDALKGGDWDSFNQEWYLSTFSMVLIAQDRETLEQMPSTRRECPARATQARVIQLLAEAIRNHKPFTAAAKFDSCFDRIRRPTEAELLTAFGMAVLRCLYAEANAAGLPHVAVARVSA